MKYKNNLKDYLTTEKISDNEIGRTLELSYRFYEFTDKFENNQTCKNPISNTRKISNAGLTEYIKINYLEKDEIDRGKLVNDLVVFKTYKYNIQSYIDDDNYFLNVLAVQISVLSILFVLLSLDEESGKYVYIICTFLFSAMGFNWKLYYDNRIKKDSDFNRIKTVDNIVNILEALNNDLYNNPVEVHEYKDFNLEVSDAEEGIKYNIYSVKVKESLEDKSK